MRALGYDTERQRLRHLGAQFYVAQVGHGQPNLREMARQDPWKTAKIPFSTLAKWKKLDNWEGQRAAVQMTVREQFVEAVSGSMVDEYTAMLRRIAPVRVKLETVINDANFQFKGSEPTDIVKAYLKVLEVQAKFAENLVKLLAPTKGGAAASPNGDQGGQAPQQSQLPQETQGALNDVFNDEEARVVARALLVHRAKQLAATSQVVDVPPAEAGKPPST